MRAAAFASADDERKIELSDLLDQALVVQWILVNVNASPYAGVVCPYGNDAQGGLYTIKVLYPEVIRRRFANDDRLPGLFPVPSRAFNFVCSVSDIQPGENRLEPRYIGHASFSVEEAGGLPRPDD